jgi:carbon starvation protein
MTILPVVLTGVVVLGVGYLIYGRKVSKWLGVDPARVTPAVQQEDGIDFVPAGAPIVLGGHFTAIAAAGPIVGPILAAQLFGWAPALLWIVIGAIFIGGVHDAGSLLSSIRHHATSITQVVRQNVSRPAYLTFLAFVWLSLIYVIIVFADITAGTFSKFESFQIVVNGKDVQAAVNGGAVAIGATAYLVCSVVLGLVLRLTKTPWWLGLIISVALMSTCIWEAPRWAAWLAQHGLGFMDTSAAQAATLSKTWHQVLLAYCFIASLVPMWLLLQPRGAIGATFLYATVLFGLAGALVGGLTGDQSLAIRWPAFTGFRSADGISLFPFLFITVACGACSGFHSIVSSGTTCKQIRNERDVRPVAYGGMLLEAVVALLALSTVMVMAKGGASGSPDVIFARGLGNFMRLLGIPIHFAIGFGLLAFSSFVFDTLDVCTRLGRYVFQEVAGLRGIAGGAIATMATIVPPSLYLAMSPPGSFRTFWIIFGTSNQLLAALTLVGVSLWLWRNGRQALFTFIPAVLMLASTGTALVINLRTFLRQYQGLIQSPLSKPMLAVNMGIAVMLLGLGALIVFEALRVWRSAVRKPATVE